MSESNRYNSARTRIPARREVILTPEEVRVKNSKAYESKPKSRLLSANDEEAEDRNTMRRVRDRRLTPFRNEDDEMRPKPPSKTITHHAAQPKQQQMRRIPPPRERDLSNDSKDTVITKATSILTSSRQDTATSILSGSKVSTTLQSMASTQPRIKSTHSSLANGRRAPPPFAKKSQQDEVDSDFERKKHINAKRIQEKAKKIQEKIEVKPVALPKPRPRLEPQSPRVKTNKPQLEEDPKSKITYRNRHLTVSGDNIISKSLTRNYIYHRQPFDWYNTDSAVLLDDVEEIVPLPGTLEDPHLNAPYEKKPISGIEEEDDESEEEVDYDDESEEEDLEESDDLTEVESISDKEEPTLIDESSEESKDSITNSINPSPIRRRRRSSEEEESSSSSSGSSYRKKDVKKKADNKKKSNESKNDSIRKQKDLKKSEDKDESVKSYKSKEKPYKETKKPKEAKEPKESKNSKDSNELKESKDLNESKGLGEQKDSPKKKEDDSLAKQIEHSASVIINTQSVTINTPMVNTNTNVPIGQPIAAAAAAAVPTPTPLVAPVAPAPPQLPQQQEQLNANPKGNIKIMIKPDEPKPRSKPKYYINGELIDFDQPNAIQEALMRQANAANNRSNTPIINIETNEGNNKQEAAYNAIKTQPLLNNLLKSASSYAMSKPSQYEQILSSPQGAKINSTGSSTNMSALYVPNKNNGYVEKPTKSTNASTFQDQPAQTTNSLLQERPDKATNTSIQVTQSGSTFKLSDSKPAYFQPSQFITRPKLVQTKDSEQNTTLTFSQESIKPLQHDQRQRLMSGSFKSSSITHSQSTTNLRQPDQLVKNILKDLVLLAAEDARRLANYSSQDKKNDVNSLSKPYQTTKTSSSSDFGKKKTVNFNPTNNYHFVQQETAASLSTNASTLPPLLSTPTKTPSTLVSSSNASTNSNYVSPYSLLLPLSDHQKPPPIPKKMNSPSKTNINLQEIQANKNGIHVFKNMNMSTPISSTTNKENLKTTTSLDLNTKKPTSQIEQSDKNKETMKLREILKGNNAASTTFIDGKKASDQLVVLVKDLKNLKVSLNLPKAKETK